MLRIVGVTELHYRLTFFIDAVARNRTPIVVTRRSHPEAVLIPYGDNFQFQQMRESEIQAGFEQVWERLDQLNEDYSNDEITGDIEESRHG